jgi:outer membrane protein, adhesin transport system
MAADRAPVTLRVAPTPATGATAPVPRAVAPAATPAPAAPAPSTSDVVRRLQDWAAAWMSHDADRYLAFYAPDFKPVKGTRAGWVAERRRLVGKAGAIGIALSAVQARALGDTRVETRFDQAYTSASFKDTMHKTLTWARVDGEWKIVGESNR